MVPKLAGIKIKMKTKYLSLLTFLLVFAFAGMAQTRSASPDVVVKNLYAAHNAKRSPFFQTKSRAAVDRYFTKAFADEIWKDAVDSKGEVGVLGADPLYNAQDTSITRFRVKKPMYGEGNRDIADVEVSFRNFKKAQIILFRLERSNGKWLIDNISYPSDGTSLREMYSEAGTASDGSARIDGQLNWAKAGSYILYVGKQTGDYAAYCFMNDSEAGKAILAACKNGERCVVDGQVDDGECKVPGLEANLSAQGKIMSVKSVKSLGKQK